MQIANRKIGPEHPCFIVAELSGNHGGNLETAKRMIDAARECGTDAVKLQTFTPEKMFDYEDIINDPILQPPWLGMKGKDIYQLTYMKNDHQLLLREYAQRKGIILFSTVCDQEAVDFWENHGSLPAYKIAAWQSGDRRLVQYAQETGKPTLISVEESFPSRYCWNGNSALLIKNDFIAIPHMKLHLRVPVGYSNHRIDPMACTRAADWGACIVEQHFTLHRDTIDGQFAALPEQFAEMAQTIRALEKARES